MAPANGEVSFSGNDAGDTATYTCDSRFDLVGEGLATCTAADGTASFQPGPPTCTPSMLHQGLIKRRACNSHNDSIDGEIKSVTKNSNTKTWIFSLLGILGKYTEN